MMSKQLLGALFLSAVSSFTFAEDIYYAVIINSFHTNSLLALNCTAPEVQIMPLFQYFSYFINTPNKYLGI